ncbi:cupin domain-containing protein [Microbulbifer yueqingensis]|uniref:Cupin 2 domain-containing protein n=1 Tax=Microbulbifer yueqingensis TaxID=658219 RepID=A0A1G9BH66_9GAMM|nr:cupin domain-containing protein [Microbulbifer yueqingensis]SDK38414.1 cupin 2 domain-containing protein [Microbulbifer yueqingensis]
MEIHNLFAHLPKAVNGELFEDLLAAGPVRIERIVSHGQVTPAGEWYNQEEGEWVLVLRGGARIEFADGTEVALGEGDYLNIPAHVRHRVSWTDPERQTVWLAVFYRQE